MTRQIAKSIAVLTILMVLSMGPVHSFAGASACSVPSCRPRAAAAPPIQKGAFPLWRMLFDLSFLYLP
jgi:hypothetical protein